MENTERMNSAVIGIFTDINAARRASEELHSVGLGPKVNLIENDQAGMETENMQREEGSENRGGLGDFFARLFGMGEENRGPDSSQTIDKGEEIGVRTAQSWDLDEESERQLKDAYHAGRHLLLVDAFGERERVASILKSQGAQILNEGQFTATSDTASDLSATQGATSEETMQLKEEKLRASKEKVQTGEVQLRKETVSDVKNIEVPYEREEVVIERRPASGNGEVSAAEDSFNAQNMKENEELRIPVSEEQVHVEKKVVPQEEVAVSKQKVTEKEQVSDELKHEEVHVESKGKVSMRDKADKKGKGYQRPSEPPSGHEARP